MAAKNGDISRIIAVGAAVLFAVLAVAEAGSVRKPYSSAQKRQTPYDILRKARQEPKAAETRELAEIGPVVAKATLRPALIKPPLGVGHFARLQQGTTQVKPTELRDVPADAPPDPVYFTLDIADRKVHGITYRSTHRTKRAKMRLDTNGDGLLSDEREYIGTWLSIFRLQTVFAFGPVSFKHTGGGSKSSQFYLHCSDGRHIMLYPMRYHKGKFELRGKTYNIALVDCNYNGKYNDILIPPVKNNREPGCDSIAIDLNGNSKFDYDKAGILEHMPLSRLIKIDGTYYHLEVADDGQTVDFHRAKPAFGTLDFGNENVGVKLWSDAGHQHLNSSNGKWRLPAGRYTTIELKLTETDSAGNKWLFDTERARGGAGAGELGAFEVRPDETTAFKIGPPFQVKTTMEKSRYADAVVRFYLQGQAGELYVPGAKKNGKDIPEPQFQIKSVTGETLYSGEFEFA